MKRGKIQQKEVEFCYVKRCFRSGKQLEQEPAVIIIILTIVTYNQNGRIVSSLKCRVVWTCMHREH